MNNESNNQDNMANAMNELVAIYAAMHDQMFIHELEATGSDYRPKTNTYGLLSISECGGPEAIARAVATVVGLIVHRATPADPVDVATDLLMGLKYKHRYYYQANIEEPSEAFDCLQEVYQKALDVAQDDILSSLSEDEVARVCDVLYE